MRKDFIALESLQLPIGPGCVVSLVSHRLPITESVQAVPLGMMEKALSFDWGTMSLYCNHNQ